MTLRFEDGRVSIARGVTGSVDESRTKRTPKGAGEEYTFTGLPTVVGLKRLGSLHHEYTFSNGPRVAVVDCVPDAGLLACTELGVDAGADASAD